MPVAKSIRSFWILRRNASLRRSVWLRSAAAATIGLSVLLGLEPFAFGLAGLAGVTAVLLLAWSLAGRPLFVIGLWGALSSLAVCALAFQWLLPTIRLYGHLSWAASLPLFVLHALLFQLKLPAALVGMEWIRRVGGVGVVWSGPLCAAMGDLLFPQLFPWFWGNLAGRGTLVNQPAASLGVTGVGFLMFLTGALSLSAARLLLHRRRRWKRGSRVRRLPRRILISLSLAGVLLLGFLAYSLLRVSETTDLLSGMPIRITMIQPNTGRGLSNLKEDEQFAATSINRVFNLALLSIVRSQGTTDLLILPESAVPFHGTRETKHNQAIYSPTFHSVIAFLARYGKTDVLYNEIDRSDGQLRNAAVVFSRAGHHQVSYFKQKLVPFGEYLPGESWLPLRALLPEASRYSAAQEVRLLVYGVEPQRPTVRLDLPDPQLLAMFGKPQEILRNWPHGPAPEQGSLVPLICYEGLFPDLVRRFVEGAPRPTGAGPDFLVNISNDAWFGDYLENYQHAGAARIRAIETGRYFVRATLSGSSSVYDPLGRALIVPTTAGTEAIHTLTIMRRPNASTPFLRYGNTGLWLLCLMALAISLRPRRGLLRPGAFVRIAPRWVSRASRHVGPPNKNRGNQ